jgi:hypothetical protein|tara:strand:- start:30 stop:176 length:147 start_codon:yes stop_codon:yes gene_type:complete
MKNSEFRKQILQFCRISFEKFFDKEIKEKADESLESKIMFQQKLFGNL